MKNVRKFAKGFLPVLAMMLVVIGIYGCISRIDPVTGQKTYIIDPNWAGVFDSAAGVVTVAAPAAVVVASTFFPGAVPIVTLIVGILGGLAGMWAKLKPQITQAKTLADQTHTVLASAVTAIEEYKKANPAEWGKLSAELQKLIPKGSSADDVISIIRGILPVAN